MIEVKSLKLKIKPSPMKEMATSTMQIKFANL